MLGLWWSQNAALLQAGRAWKDRSGKGLERCLKEPTRAGVRGCYGYQAALEVYPPPPDKAIFLCEAQREDAQGLKPNSPQELGEQWQSHQSTCHMPTAKLGVTSAVRGTHVESCFMNICSDRMRLNSEVRANVPCTLWVLFCFAGFLFSLEPELTSHLSVWFSCTWQPSNWTNTGLGQWGNNWAATQSGRSPLSTWASDCGFPGSRWWSWLLKSKPLSLLMSIIKLNNSRAPTTYGAPYKTQIYPALSGNEVFHISECSGKLGLTSLGSIFFLKILTVWDGNMCQICNILSYLAKQLIRYCIHHFTWMSPHEHALKHRWEGSPSIACLGLYWDSPLRLDLEAAVCRSLCGPQ